jgi:crotonobetainyl-CoA:carnitine CoA-transferase CaiB-like acyl-CoA transferase
VEKLGSATSRCAARRPDIIYASMNTYGRVGPYAGRP